MIKRIYIIILVISVFHISCSEESNPTFDTDNFTSIFDNSQFDASYFPIDIQQTPDGGYLILGGRKLADSNFSGIYLMKADKFGSFVSEVEVEETSVHPIGKLTKYQDKYYFFCMDPLTQAQIASVDADLAAVTITPVQNGLTYPAAATFINADNQFVLLSYNNDSKESVISLVNVSGGVEASEGYSIGTGEDIEEPIINHFIRTGRQYPFEVGRVASGLYFFNGFFDYTFSLVFTDIRSEEPRGVVQGQHDDGGFSAVITLGGSKFASARFNFGDNYLLPNKDLTTTGNTMSTDLGGYTLPEMVKNAKVRILRATVANKNVLIYGTDTKSKQIGLLFYEEGSGTFLSSRYLGFSNPFEIANFTQTEDGGLAICGTTYLAGRFPRICIFKISRDELAENVK